MNGRSPVWIRVCSAMLFLCGKVAPHPGTSHLNGRSPVWTRACSAAWCLCENAASQPGTSHLNGRSPVWVRSCRAAPPGKHAVQQPLTRQSTLPFSNRCRFGGLPPHAGGGGGGQDPAPSEPEAPGLGGVEGDGGWDMAAGPERAWKAELKPRASLELFSLCSRRFFAPLNAASPSGSRQRSAWPGSDQRTGVSC